MADNKTAKTAETKTRKQRASKKRNYDQVMQDCFDLPLKQRAVLAKEVKDSIVKELDDLIAESKEAANIIGIA